MRKNNISKIHETCMLLFHSSREIGACEKSVKDKLKIINILYDLDYTHLTQAEIQKLYEIKLILSELIRMTELKKQSHLEKLSIFKKHRFVQNAYQKNI